MNRMVVLILACSLLVIAPTAFVVPPALDVRTSAQAMAEKQEQQESNKTPIQNQELDTSKLKELTPYRIASYFWDNHQADPRVVWQKLDIESNYFGERHYDESAKFFTKCHNCEADVFDYELDGEPGSEVVVRIADLLQESCRYLIFKENIDRSESDRWKFLGAIDHDFGRYKMPQHIILLSGGKSWLIIQVQEGSGSDIALYHNRLFRINNDGIQEVLKWPAEGHHHEHMYRTRRYFASRIVDCKATNGITTVEVEYTVKYFGNDYRDWLLWSKKQRANYISRSRSAKAALDRSNSDMSEEEIKAVYNVWSLSDKALLKYNFDELKRIATVNDRRKQEWLRNFLGRCECNGTPEKDSLRQILAQ